MFKKITVLFLIFFPLVALAQSDPSLDIEINVRPEVVVGENLEFSYKFISDINQSIKYIPRIECDTVPMPMLEVKDLELQKGVAIQEKFFSAIIKDNVESQTCKAIIEVIEPFNAIKEQEFKIVTEPNLDIDISFCKDLNCQKRSKVYKVGEDIYINYESEAKNIIVSAKIMKDDKLLEELTLPANTKLYQSGNYTVTISSQAEGYKDNVQSLPITVLEGDIKVNNKIICQVDGECSGEETVQNCPQDCQEVKQEEKSVTLEKSLISIIVIGTSLCLFILIIVIMFWFFKKRNIRVKERSDLDKQKDHNNNDSRPDSNLE